MAGLSLGVLCTTRKENEQRLPIHPLHLDRIGPDIRDQVFLETGYGERFGIPDDRLAGQVGGLRPRAELLAECDVILLPKPLAADLAELPDGAVLWGWPHCVQDTAITQLAIDKRLTLLAFEAMNHWGSDGQFQIHVFHKNNEMAGYASVLHALQLIGTSGTYGRKLTAAVIGFGATGRGAVTALHAVGVPDVTVLTQRETAAVASPIEPMTLVQLSTDPEDAARHQAQTADGPVPLAGLLAEHDIVVNCVLQNPDAPLTFLTDDDLPSLASGSLIVDVSCDEGMGFSWARPTPFTDPMFTVGDNVHYYGVDHSPSYLWDSATWEISEALLPYLPTVLAGPQAWTSEETVRRCIEIQDGEVRNEQILSFQNRDADYPHPRRAG
ncbi:MAG: N(5)-(carboxyethyl)ornithine synthase [Geodermatophilaceae bacterium]